MRRWVMSRRGDTGVHEVCCRRRGERAGADLCSLRFHPVGRRALPAATGYVLDGGDHDSNTRLHSFLCTVHILCPLPSIPSVFQVCASSNTGTAEPAWQVLVVSFVSASSFLGVISAWLAFCGAQMVLLLKKPERWQH
jgi:hypothetical protein